MTAYEQLKGIIVDLMDNQDYPKWDFINGVLSSERFNEKSLWYHWGRLLIVPNNSKKTLAKDFEELDEWNVEKDGTFTFLGRKW